MKREDLTKKILSELLQYEPSTGMLRWRVRGKKWFNSLASCNRWNATYAGKPALTSRDPLNGYCIGTVLGITVAAHRVIWIMMTGKHPKGGIEHANKKNHDNRWSNLRDVSISEIRYKSAQKRKSASGVVGVAVNKDGRFVARIGQEYLGTHDSLSKAKKARKEAEQRLNA